MTNEEILMQTFAESLGLSRDRINDELAYNTIPEWDSIAHMALVAAIERKFNIMFDTDDILGMSTVSVSRAILAKHGVALVTA